MSRRGNCYNNAYVESFFASLKKEKIYRTEYNTEDQQGLLASQNTVAKYMKELTLDARLKYYLAVVMVPPLDVQTKLIKKPDSNGLCSYTGTLTG